jgi:hypothetical protein
MSRIPGFEAETSLDRQRGTYRAMTAVATSGAVGGLSMLGPATGFLIDLFPPLLCCSPGFGCITRRWSPLEHCKCIRDFSGPRFFCRPSVARP